MENNFNKGLENFHNKEKLKRLIKTYFSKKINQINIVSTNQDQILLNLMDEGYFILNQIENLKKIIKKEQEYNHKINNTNQSQKNLSSTIKKNNNNFNSKNKRISLSKSQEKDKIIQINNSVFEKLYRSRKRENTNTFHSKLFICYSIKNKTLKEKENKNLTPKIKNLIIRKENKSKTVKNTFKFETKNNKNSIICKSNKKKDHNILRLNLNFSNKLEINKYNDTKNIDFES